MGRWEDETKYIKYESRPDSQEPKWVAHGECGGPLSCSHSLWLGFTGLVTVPQTLALVSPSYLASSETWLLLMTQVPDHYI